MKLPFSARLAASNLKKQSRSSLPFMLASVGVVTMQFMIATLADSRELGDLFGGDTMMMMLSFGRVVTAIFSCILLFYTHSFLIKRRLKEFAVYNILGMEKRHIGRVLLWETLCMLGISLILGVGLGALLSRLMYVIVLNIIDAPILAFHFSPDALRITALLFCGIYAAIHVYDVLRLRLSCPVTLLRDGQAGEREPKHSWIGAVLGLICLGAGYGLALTIQNPILALAVFFVAVLLVMAGTYLLFGSGSIALLKLLRRNPNYYYKPNHFISVSGMMFRMKRNAVGLANICILSTMALVTISSTVSLWLGLEDMLNNMYPYDFFLDLPCDKYAVVENGDPALTKLVQDQLSAAQIEAQQVIPEIYDYTSLSFTVHYEDGKLQLYSGFDDDLATINTYNNLRELTCCTLSEFNANTGSDRTLSPGEVLLVDCDGQFDRDRITAIDVDDVHLEVCDALPAELSRAMVSPNFTMPEYMLVVPDAQALNDLWQAQQQYYGVNASGFSRRVAFDLPDASPEQKLVMNDALRHCFVNTDVAIACREANRSEYRITFGGALFLGIFLGSLFLAATVLIIYYKQVSEGFEDRSRYAIMRKVGLTEREIRASVHAQVLTVFFLPPLTAAVHIAFAFPMIRKLLMLFRLTNARLTVLCTAACLLAFLAVYTVIYLITARSYTRIVSTSER